MTGAEALAAPVLGDAYAVTPDALGGGVNDAGVPFTDWEISRPDTERRRGARLASVTVYADGVTPAIVWDRLADGATVADIRAAERLAEALAERYPGALATGRYAAAVAARGGAA